MSMLIVGGLFAIALLAIIGLVVLVVNDRSTRVARPEAQAASVTTNVADTRHHVTASEAAVSPADPVPSKAEDKDALLQIPVMDEQFYELSAQIRILYQQVQDMEYRLKALIELTERFENVAYQARSLDEKLPMTPLSIE